MDWNLTYTKKEQKGLLYENGANEKIVCHFELKLWTFFWGHDEREWPLESSLLDYISILIISVDWCNLVIHSSIDALIIKSEIGIGHFWKM